ncbi:ORF6N domain-containing protein [Candidatus Woesearchaeota archaeon]|nr:ORF6N domain-containing protein [Candidatus Woesearchaeota archaeon]
MKEIITKTSIRELIHTIRGRQVMIDSDLAELYGVETKQLNRAVKRNIERFPKEFMFQLTEAEFKNMKSQNSISNNLFLSSGSKISKDKNNLRFQNGTSSFKHGGRRYLPYAFTEQGVSMLSAVLRSKTAVKVSIQIMNTFVSMRKFISKNADLFFRLDNVERKLIEFQIDTDKKFKKVFEAIEDKSVLKNKGIFFDGQIFDAYKFVSDLIRNANSSIVLVDNYIDDSVLTLFSKRKKGIEVIIYTKKITKQLKLDLKKFNSQYKKIEIKEFRKSHDRFMIIDNKEVYHFGASLKDLGKKWFGFSKFDKKAFKLMERLG